MKRWHLRTRMVDIEHTTVAAYAGMDGEAYI